MHTDAAASSTLHQNTNDPVSDKLVILSPLPLPVQLYMQCNHTIGDGGNSSYSLYRTVHNTRLVAQEFHWTTNSNESAEVGGAFARFFARVVGYHG
jgi:hypothetical protein